MEEIRWIQRFENYNQALSNFLDTVNCIKTEGINKIYTMAIVQAFEIAFELGWKVMKDNLEYNGIVANSPRSVIKAAFANGIISDGQGWIDMMEARNKTLECYKDDILKQLYNDIISLYYLQFIDLRNHLQNM